MYVSLPFLLAQHVQHDKEEGNSVDVVLSKHEFHEVGCCVSKFLLRAGKESLEPRPSLPLLPSSLMFVSFCTYFPYSQGVQRGIIGEIIKVRFLPIFEFHWLSILI